MGPNARRSNKGNHLCAELLCFSLDECSLVGRVRGSLPCAFELTNDFIEAFRLFLLLLQASPQRVDDLLVVLLSAILLVSGNTRKGWGAR